MVISTKYFYNAIAVCLVSEVLILVRKNKFKAQTSASKVMASDLLR
jgi:hypothetical protein